MIVYHGSCLEVTSPDTIHSRKTVDFGQGFYVTPIYDQAKKWAEKFKRRGKQAVISEDGYSEKTFNFPDDRKYRSLQFIVKDSEHQEQHSVTVMFDGIVKARQMPYCC